MKHAATSKQFCQRAIRISEVCRRVGISRTQIYRLVSRGAFPSPVHISERISVWREADIDAWLWLLFLPDEVFSEEVDNG